MASWLIRMDSSLGKSTLRRLEICSGLQAFTQRRSARWGLPFPFHFGPGGPISRPSAVSRHGGQSLLDVGTQPVVIDQLGHSWRVVTRRSACHWLSMLCSQVGRSVSTCCDAALSRSSTGADRDVGRSHVHQAFAHARWRCPLARRTTSSDPSLSEEGKGSHHQRGGTTVRDRG